MPSTPSVKRTCRDCTTPLPPKSRRTYCEAHALARRTANNAKNTKAWRQRQADARTARQVAAKGRATRTPGVLLDGPSVVELKLLMDELERARRALALRNAPPFDPVTEIEEQIAAIEGVVAAHARLLPATAVTR